MTGPRPSSNGANKLPRTISSIVPLDLRQLPPKELEVYHQWLEKSLWVCLLGQDPWGIKSAVIHAMAALSENNQPVGLVLATFYPSLAWAKLLALHLAPPYSHISSYMSLLKGFEDHLRQQKCRLLTHLYSTGSDQAAELEGLFRQAEWSAPQIAMVRCHFAVQTFQTPWLARALELVLPADFEIFPWSKLRPQDEQLLQHQLQQSTFPLSVSPFHEKQTIESINSLGVRYRGKVIGWVISNRVAPDTVSFSSFYVDRDFRGTKVPICLLARSIALLKASDIPKAIFEFNLAQVERHWIDFVKKRLVPAAQQVERLYEVYHQL